MYFSKPDAKVALMPHAKLNMHLSIEHFVQMFSFTAEFILSPLPCTPITFSVHSKPVSEIDKRPGSVSSERTEVTAV